MSYHKSCDTLPYINFLRAIRQNDLTQLIITPENETKTELELTLAEIAQEYAGKIKFGKTQSVFETWKKIIFLEWKKEIIRTCIWFLRRSYNEEVAGILTNQGFPDLPNDSNLQKVLNDIEIESQNIDVFLSLRYKEYNDLQNEANNSNQAKDFDTDLKEIAVLSKFQGYKIANETVSEVCAIINVFLEKIKA